MKNEIISKYMNELNERLDIIFDNLKKEIINDIEKTIINGIDYGICRDLTINNKDEKAILNEILSKVSFSGTSKGRFIVIKVKTMNEQLKLYNISKKRFLEIIDYYGACRKNKDGKYTHIVSDKNTTSRVYKIDKYYLIQNEIDYPSYDYDKDKFKIVDNKIAYVIKNGFDIEYIY